MEENDQYHCEACGRAFETRSELEGHVHDIGLVD